MSGLLNTLVEILSYYCRLSEIYPLLRLDRKCELESVLLYESIISDIGSSLGVEPYLKKNPDSQGTFFYFRRLDMMNPAIPCSMRLFLV